MQDEGSLANKFRNQGIAVHSTPVRNVNRLLDASGCTAGEVTREELAKEGVTYVPYADQFRLYEKIPHWLEYRAAFEKSWTPYLDSGGDFREAIKAVFASLSVQANVGSLVREAFFGWAKVRDSAA